MDTVMQLLTDFIPVIAALGGAMVGGYFSRKSQNDAIQLQIERDKEIAKKQEMNELMSIYNDILRINGEKIMVAHVGGGHTELDIKLYEQAIRPLVYEKFHLIHENVAKIVEKIDRKLAECNFHEEITPENHQFLATAYWDLINKINEHLAEYRESRFNYK
ncbi:hypothetical protein [Thalassobacillus hwangdonensis]|uniref:Uncharacterized protein n=1 Tax=Thalassobacillus hwangdonensis TaxID=546108 RepID=A0ABW3KZJ6_9BACI